MKKTKGVLFMKHRVYSQKPWSQLSGQWARRI